MHVVEHASRDANDENFQASPGFVLHATGDINDHVLVKFNLKPIEQHPALAVEDVIDLVRPLMIMQFGVGDLEMMNLGRGIVLLFQERADLATGFGPRLHVG